MTAVIGVSAPQVPNALKLSLIVGFDLTAAQAEDVAAIMRRTSPMDRIVVLATSMSDAERRQATARFFAFVGYETAELLAITLRANVTGFVICRCPLDQFFTLIPEHD